MEQSEIELKLIKIKKSNKIILITNGTNEGEIFFT